MVLTPPTLGNGKICYIVIPATDVRRSADFYATVFGWEVRTRGDGSLAFNDGVGQVSGTWAVGPPPAERPGLMMYIMVDDIAAACDVVAANGGEIVKPVDPKAREIVATFRDPAGNVLGLYQDRA